MMNKRVKVAGACVLALALTLAGLKLPSAYAALPVDLDQKGSIEFSLDQNVDTAPEAPGEDGTVAEPVKLDAELKELKLDIHLYQVAEIKESGAYTVTANFTDLDTDVKAISSTTSAADWTDMAAKAAKVVMETKNLTGTDVQKAVCDESVTADELKLGLYLVTVENVVTDRYIYSFNPYLISVPNNYFYTSGSDDWIYDLTGDKAVGLKPERTSRLGDLVIEKRLESYNASLGGAYFVYEVIVEKPDGTVETNVYKLSFEDAGNASLTIRDLPAGATVKVKEVYTGASYKLTTEAEQTTAITANPNSDKKALGEEETDGDGTEPYEPASVSFTNSYDGRQNGGSGVVNTFYKNGEKVDWRNDIGPEVNEG